MGKVKEVKIETGITQDEMIEVKTGIKAGDQIVTVGVEDLKDGSSVRVKKWRLLKALWTVRLP